MLNVGSVLKYMCTRWSYCVFFLGVCAVLWSGFLVSILTACLSVCSTWAPCVSPQSCKCDSAWLGLQWSASGPFLSSLSVPLALAVRLFSVSHPVFTHFQPGPSCVAVSSHHSPVPSLHHLHTDTAHHHRTSPLLVLLPADYIRQHPVDGRFITSLLFLLLLCCLYASLKHH